MNKITKPILVSALSALAFGTIGVAGTFALFTDDSKTTISAKAGIVDVGLTPSGLTTYSAEANAQGDRIDERGAKYISKLTAVQGTFTNGGTASLADGALTMRKLTPGDRVTFDAGLVNHSNVAIKYRLVYKFTGTSGVLAQGLVTKTNISGSAKTYEGLREFVAPWTFLEAGAALPSTAITFDIELPIDRGNDYQGKEASFSLYVEAVQGNAYVEDDPKTLLFGELTPAQEATQEVEDPAQPIVLQTTSALATTTVKTTIPASTSYQTDPQQAAEPIAADDTVKLVVSDLVVSKDTATKKGTIDLDIALLVNGVEVTQFSEDVAVEVNVGKNLDITSVTHNGKAVTGYTYTASEGILRFTTKNFSPFSVEYSIVPNTSYGFFDSYVQDGHWVHEIKTKAHFKNIMDHIQARGSLSAEGYPLADKTSVYKILNDIDFGGGNLWAANESVYGSRFTGTLTAASQVTLSNIQATTVVTNSIAKDGDNVVVALFGAAKDAHFENVTLSNISINNGSAEYSGLFVQGNNTGGDGFGGDISFTNCIVESDCSISIAKSGHAFLPLPRFYNAITFTNCVNKADITCQGYGASAFLGNGTSGHAAITFTNCSNYGDMTATYLASGFNAYTSSGNHSITMTNCYNYGDINVTNENGYHGAFFLTDNSSSWYTSVTMNNIVNYGKMYVNSSDGTVNSAHFDNNYEYKHYGTGAGEYQIINGNTGLTVAKADYYSTFVEVGNIDELTLGFDDNFKLVSSAHEDVDHVTVTLTAHNLRLSRQTGQEYPSLMGGESGYIQSFNFDSLEEIDILRVSQVGYYIPDGAHSPESPINYGFDRYLLNSATSSYTDGYHAREDGKSYFVITNGAQSDVYFAICVWRNRIEYTVTAYDSNNKIVAKGSTQYGWDNASSGYDSLLTAITTD